MPNASAAPESMLLQSEIPEDATLAERAYLQLRDRIVTLRMPPGSLVREDEMIKELGMSRTPIREALLRLALEKLIMPITRRGTFVSDVNVGDVRTIYELRRELEGAAAAWAAERRTDADIQEIDALIEELGVVPTYNSVDARAQMSPDQKAHFLIYRMCRNELLSEALRMHYFLSARIWFLASGRVTMEEPFDLQIQLLTAIKAGDTERARRLAQLHNDHAESTLRTAL
jgi:DNA-binding GntR family transcriptional regulator